MAHLNGKAVALYASCIVVAGAGIFCLFRFTPLSSGLSQLSDSISRLPGFPNYKKDEKKEDKGPAYVTSRTRYKTNSKERALPQRSNAANAAAIGAEAAKNEAGVAAAKAVNEAGAQAFSDTANKQLAAASAQSAERFAQVNDDIDTSNESLHFSNTVDNSGGSSNNKTNADSSSGNSASSASQEAKTNA